MWIYVFLEFCIIYKRPASKSKHPIPTMKEMVRLFLEANKRPTIVNSWWSRKQKQIMNY